MSTILSMTGMSSVDLSVDNISSTIPFDLINVSPNLKSGFESTTEIDLLPE